MNITLNQFSYDFGMQMPGRNGSTGEYRYGAQGMEKDDEIKGEGNSYDFGARIYDPRIGRWLTMDKKAAKQPSMSPYKSFNNSPLIFIDPDGNTEYQINITIDKDGNAHMKVKTARGVMKQGESLIWESRATYRVEANWYDYATITVTQVNDDGSTTTTKDQFALTQNGIKQTDIVWFYADEDGTTWEDGDPALEEGIERSFGIAMGGSGGGVIGQDWSENAVGSIDFEELETIMKRPGFAKDGYKPGTGSWQGMTDADAKDWLKFIQDGVEMGEDIIEIYEGITGNGNSSTGNGGMPSGGEKDKQETKYRCPTCSKEYPASDTTKHNESLGRESGPFEKVEEK